MIPVQLPEQVLCLLLTEIRVDFHSTTQTLLKWCRNKNTDVRNMIVGQDHIGTAAHHNKIFMSRHLADQVTLVKKIASRLLKP